MSDPHSHTSEHRLIEDEISMNEDEDACVPALTRTVSSINPASTPWDADDGRNEQYDTEFLDVGLNTIRDIAGRSSPTDSRALCQDNMGRMQSIYDASNNLVGKRDVDDELYVAGTSMEGGEVSLNGGMDSHSATESRSGSSHSARAMDECEEELLIDWHVFEILLGQAEKQISPSSRWQEPILPNNQLIAAVLKLTDMIKLGLDVSSTGGHEQESSLLEKVIFPVLLKMFYDEHSSISLEMKRNVMSLIYHFCILFVEKLKRPNLNLDDFPNDYWVIMRIIFDYRNKFYHKLSNSSLDGIAHVVPGDLDMSLFNSVCVACDGFKWYQSILVWFAQNRGFDAYSAFLTRVLPTASLTSAASYVDWIYGSQFFLNPKYMQSLIGTPLIETADRMIKLTDKEMECEKLKNELKDSAIIRLYTVIKWYIAVINNRGKIYDESLIKVSRDLDEFKLRFLKNVMLFSAFNIRMSGLDELYRFLNSMYTDQYAPSTLTISDLEVWIESNNLVDALYKDNLHHVAYIDRLEKVMGEMFDREVLLENVLTIIWNSQKGKHDAIQRNVNSLTARLVWRFNDTVVRAFFARLEASWLDGGLKERETIIELCRKVGLDFCSKLDLNLPKYETLKEIVLLLWKQLRSCQEADSSTPELKQKVSDVIFEILGESESSCYGRESLIPLLANKCIEDVHDNNNRFIASSVRLLKKLIDIYPSRGHGLSSHAYDRQMVVNMFEKVMGKSLLLMMVDNICGFTNSLCRGLKETDTTREVLSETSAALSDGSDDYSTEESVDGLIARLEFLLYYVIQLSDCSSDHVFDLFLSCELNPEQSVYKVDLLWDSLIESGSYPIRDIGFKYFFTPFLNHDRIQILPSIEKFFNERVLVLDQTSLSMEGFFAFEAFLKKTNLALGLMISPLKNGHLLGSVEVLDGSCDMSYSLVRAIELRGSKFLRELICRAENKIVSERASKLYVNLFSSQSSGSVEQNEEHANVVVSQCNDWIVEKNDELINCVYDYRSTEAMRRVLQTVSDLVDTNERMNRTICRRFRLPLRRAVMGKGFIVRVQFREDINMVFKPAATPQLSEKTFNVHENMFLGELFEKVCNHICSKGGILTPYALVITRKQSPSAPGSNKFSYNDWGWTMRDLGIEGRTGRPLLIARIEKIRVGTDPDTDPLYQSVTSLAACELREANLFSVLLANTERLVERLLGLAETKELTEHALQLLFSIPKPDSYAPVLDHCSYVNSDSIVNCTSPSISQQAMQELLSEVENAPTAVKQIYQLMLLNEIFLPVHLTSDDNMGNQVTFFKCYGVKTCLKLLTEGKFVNNELGLKLLEDIGACIITRMLPFALIMSACVADTVHMAPIAFVRDTVQRLLKLHSDNWIFEAVENLSPHQLIDANPNLFHQVDIEPVLMESILQLFMSGFDANRSAHLAILEPPTDPDAAEFMMADQYQCESDVFVLNCANTFFLLCFFNIDKSSVVFESDAWNKYVMTAVCDDRRNNISPLCWEILFELVVLYEHISTTVILVTVDKLLDQIDQLEQRDQTETIYYWTFLSNLIKRVTKCKLRVHCLEDRIRDVVRWLDEAQKQSQEMQSHYPDDETLAGRLQICKALVQQLTPNEKASLSVMEGGPRLVEQLLFYFVLPSSRAYAQHERDDIANGASVVPRSHTAMEIHTATSSSMFDLHAGNSIPRSNSACPLPHRCVAVCGTERSQREAYMLLVELSSECEPALQFIADQTIDMFYRNRSLQRIMWEYNPDHSLREAGNYVGLKNGGATCYMNSILQQLFMVTDLRNAIMNAEPANSQVAEEEPTTDNSSNYSVEILNALQSVFAHLVGYELDAYTPTDFWKTFRMNGVTLNLQEQQDALEFYHSIVDLTDQGLKKIGAEKICEKTFGGLFADEKICKDCPHRYSRSEPFTSISIDVRSHNNLLDSLREYVRGDVLENDNAYFCENCNRKVRAVKRLSIQKLPTNLVVQLKRFEFDWERECPVKFNDYFEFPFDLDMHSYTQEALARADAVAEAEANGEMTSLEDEKDYDIRKDCHYRLRGVVVHSGQATGGHYYSYIRSSDDGRWYKFDDTDVSHYECDPKDVKYKWFGEETKNENDDYRKRRQRSWWNAYLLMYEKVPTSQTASVTDPSVSNVIAGTSVLPVATPLTVEAVSAPLDSSRRSSTGSPVSRLHKHFSTMSLSSRLRQMPPRLEEMVRRQNTRIMHERNQYSANFFEFIYLLVKRTLLTPTDQRRCLLATKLLSQFLVHTWFHSSAELRGSVELKYNEEGKDFISWLDLLYHLLADRDRRFWFICNILFVPEIQKTFAIDARESEIRLMYIGLLQRVLLICYDGRDTMDDLMRSNYNTSYILSTDSQKRPLVAEQIIYTMRQLFLKEWDARHVDMFILLTNFAFEDDASRLPLVCSMVKHDLLYHMMVILENGYVNSMKQPLQTQFILLLTRMLRCVDFSFYLCHKIRQDVRFSEDLAVLEMVRCPQILPQPENVIGIEHLDHQSDLIEMMLIQRPRDRCFANLIDHLTVQSVQGSNYLTKAYTESVLFLAWNNEIIARKTYETLVRSLMAGLDTSSEGVIVRVLERMQQLLTNGDLLNRSEKIMKFLLFEIEVPTIDSRGIMRSSQDIGLTSLMSANCVHRTQRQEENLLRALVVVVESNPYMAIRMFVKHRLNVFIETVLSTFLSRSAMRITDRRFPSFDSEINPLGLPTSIDVAERFQTFAIGWPEAAALMQATTDDEEEDEEDPESCEDEDDIDEDDDDEDEGVVPEDGPLDLSVTGRAQAATPQSGEKRPFPEDDSPMSGRRDSKKFNDGSEVPRATMDDTELLMSTSRSAVDVKGDHMDSAPPPAYESGELD